jgi:3-mercaptopyruvate sulfurtransferase SseA
MERGYTLVRPLAGGLDAWTAAGYDVEAAPLVAVRPAAADPNASA